MASLTITEPNKEPRTMPLGAEALVIGRSQSKCNLTFDFLGLSGKHCEIVQSGETFKIIDLDSANHTYVNGRMIAEHYLNHSDRITLGVIVLTFNNESQKQPKGASSAKTAAPPPEADPGTFAEPTFVMDGEKLRKKMREIQSGNMPGVAEDGAPKPPIGASAKDYAEAVNKSEKANSGGGSSILVWAFAGLSLFLLLALVLVLLVHLKVI